MEKKLNKKTPFTDYDVQEKALKLIQDHQNDEIINPVKSYAYNKGIGINTILRIAGLLLRDEYLKLKKK